LRTNKTLSPISKKKAPLKQGKRDSEPNPRHKKDFNDLLDLAVSHKRKKTG